MKLTTKTPTNMTSRKVKVSRYHVKNECSESLFPKCTLGGAWLRAAGFEIGDTVVIEVEKDKLTIKKVE